MKWLLILAVSLGFFVMPSCLPAGTAHADVLYRLTDLGGIGGADSRAWGINNSGDVVGSAFTGYEEIYHAYHYSDGTITDLRPIYNRVSGAWAINGSGVVAGSFHNGETLHAAIWQNGTMTDIDPGGYLSSARAINDAGFITGSAHFGGLQHAFRYSGNGLEDLGTLGGARSFGMSINSRGDIVGNSFVTAEEQHAFLCRAGGTMQDLGTLGGLYSLANDINDRGVIVGQAWREDGTYKAFIFSDGVMSELGTPNDFFSCANAINESGIIVGWWSPNNYERFASVTINGAMTDLNSLLEPCGWTLAEAAGINDAGQIVGWGYDPQGIDRGFLLTPIPSPASALLLSLLICLRSKRSRTPPSGVFL